MMEHSASVQDMGASEEESDGSEVTQSASVPYTVIRTPAHIQAVALNHEINTRVQPGDSCKLNSFATITNLSKSVPVLGDILKRAPQLWQNETESEHDDDTSSANTASVRTNNTMNVVGLGGDVLNKSACDKVVSNSIIVKTIDYASVTNELNSANLHSRPINPASTLDATPDNQNSTGSQLHQLATLPDCDDISDVTSLQSPTGVSAHALQAGETSSVVDEQSVSCVRSPSGRPVRKLGKRRCTDFITCPMCETRVSRDRAHDHVKFETEELNKWMRKYMRNKSEKRRSRESPAMSSSGGQLVGSESDRAVRYQSYQRVKRNRQLRGPVRTRGVECPVCNEHIHGSQEQVNQHVNRCLAKEDDGVEVDVIGSDNVSDDESYEEYEWAGQKRVRITSMAGGNLAAMGYQVARAAESGSEEELDIEQDNTHVYGHNQYNEADLIPCEADEPGEEQQRRAIRQALLVNTESSPISSPHANSTKRLASVANDNHTGSQSLVSCHSSNETATISGSLSLPNGTDNGVSGPNSEPRIELDTRQSNHSASHSLSIKTVECLKQRIRDLESMVAHSQSMRCLICMESYSNPVTSVQCWHVYCEQCWLRSLGMKKLCPQCNMITHPADLRKIYL